MTRTQQQTCKVCGQPDFFDFHVPDAIWESVVHRHLRNKVVCIGCFDEGAAAQGIHYAADLDILYFAGKAATFIFIKHSGEDI